MHDCAVIITTLLRPTLEQAVLSVWRQEFAGRIQVVLGLDQAFASAPAAAAMLARLRAACPARHSMVVIDLGYSTAQRHGGLYNNAYGGMMPAIASFAADSRHIAYLDDDDWWGPEHVHTLLAACRERPWAYTLSWFVNPANDEPMCIDLLEAAGPGRGAYRERFGGFVRPSCLMLDKLACAEFLQLWSVAEFDGGMGSDRTLFAALRQHRPGWGETGLASVFWRVAPTDVNHPHRLVYARAMGYDVTRVPGHEQIEALRQSGENYAAVQAVLALPPHV